MRIVEVSENKKQYLDLLLLADEQEDMVDRYLYKGKMYVLDDDGVKCECGANVELYICATLAFHSVIIENIHFTFIEITVNHIFLLIRQ